MWPACFMVLLLAALNTADDSIHEFHVTSVPPGSFHCIDAKMVSLKCTAHASWKAKFTWHKKIGNEWKELHKDDDHYQVLRIVDNQTPSTTEDFRILNLRREDAGAYRCEAVDGENCGLAELEVKAFDCPEPVFTTTVQTTTTTTTTTMATTTTPTDIHNVTVTLSHPDGICLNGRLIQLNCVAYGTWGARFTWHKKTDAGWVELFSGNYEFGHSDRLRICNVPPSATTESFRIFTVKKAAAGVYRCTAQDRGKPAETEVELKVSECKEQILVTLTDEQGVRALRIPLAGFDHSMYYASFANRVAKGSNVTVNCSIIMPDPSVVEPDNWKQWQASNLERMGNYVVLETQTHNMANPGAQQLLPKTCPLKYKMKPDVKVFLN